jgi:3-hydroxyisobutyrate dehydrogenase-like beta-hydroxyacid dehydrogenase
MSTDSTATPPAAACRVAFLGLGVMGYPMAGHLARGGHAVTVYNRTAAKAADWAAAHGGAHAPSPREAAAGADVVCACVGNDDDLRSVALGPDGAFAGMKPGAVFVDHTTASAEVARELHAAARQQGLHFIDAPVSGGQAGAVNGVLTVMCGGDAEPFAAARPVVMAYARACTLLGPSGAGQLAKSWQMDNRGKTMLEGRFDFGFAVDWMRKDLGLVLDEARHNGAQLPVTALVDQFYADIQARGGQRWDTSSLIVRLGG